MYYVYIIKSIGSDWYYVGLTADLHKRVAEHNKGLQKSTMNRKPYELIHFEQFETRVDARKREKQLKNGHYKRRFIQELNGGCGSVG